MDAVNSHRVWLIVAVVAAHFCVRSESLKKKVDIGIVVDRVPMDGQDWRNAHWQPRHVAEQPTLIRAIAHSLITGSMDVRFSVLTVNDTFDETLSFNDGVIGGDYETKINTSLWNLSFQKIDRAGNTAGQNLVAHAKTKLRQGVGNRAEVPDVLLWMTFYDFSNDRISPESRTLVRPPLIKSIQAFQNLKMAPILISVMRTIIWTNYETQLHVVDGSNGTYAVSNFTWSMKNEFTKKIQNVVAGLLGKCISTVTDSDCYFDAKKSCKMNTTYIPPPMQNPLDIQYCMNGAIVSNCSKGVEKCQETCNKAKQEEKPCDAPCDGVGNIENRPENADTNEMLKYCPVQRTPCKGPPCEAGNASEPAVQSPTTKEASLLPPWAIGLIAGVGAVFLGFLIFVVIFCVRWSKRKSDSRVERGKHPPHAHGHHGQYARHGPRGHPPPAAHHQRYSRESSLASGPYARPGSPA